MMGNLLAPSHVITIFLVALLLFGPRKLPELGRGFGQMMRGFKDEMEGRPNERDTNRSSEAVDASKPKE